MNANFELNRTTLQALLENPNDLNQIDLIEIRNVNNELNKILQDNNVPMNYRDQYIVTGSCAATLAGVGESYSDIDIFTDENLTLKPVFKHVNSRVEFVIKQKWDLVFKTRVDKDKRMMVFGSLIIHLFDLDCCRFVCIRRDGEWILYTCSSGLRFLTEKVNYVDRYNARSLKVHSRIQKYKERGCKSVYEMPDRINLSGDIYSSGTSKNQKKHGTRGPNVVFDDRDLPWFLSNQHGIDVKVPLPWYQKYIKRQADVNDQDEMRQLIVETVLGLGVRSSIFGAIIELLEQLPDDQLQVFDKLLHEAGVSNSRFTKRFPRTNLSKVRYQYTENGMIYCFYPIKHKKQIFWIKVTYSKTHEIADIGFFAYEDYKNYRNRAKAYLDKDCDLYIRNLSKGPLPLKVHGRALELFPAVESDGESDDEC